MIGQSELQESLNKLKSIEELPRSIIIEGSKGLGKHTFLDLISKKFNVEILSLDIDLKIDFDRIYKPTICLIDNDKIRQEKQIIKFQNTLLKIVEEPPELVWIIILTENSTDLISTIRNRCQIIKLKSYSINELRQVQEIAHKNYPDEILNLLKTPGRIIDMNEQDVIDTWNLTENIIKSLSHATPSNALSIENKFFGDCLDLDLFIDFMKANLMKHYINNGVDKYYWAFIETRNFSNNLKILNVNKKHLFENYILRLKRFLSYD